MLAYRKWNNLGALHLTRRVDNNERNIFIYDISQLHMLTKCKSLHRSITFWYLNTHQAVKMMTHQITTYMDCTVSTSAPTYWQRTDTVSQLKRCVPVCCNSVSSAAVSSMRQPSARRFLALLTFRGWLNSISNTAS